MERKDKKERESLRPFRNATIGPRSGRPRGGESLVGQTIKKHVTVWGCWKGPWDRHITGFRQGLVWQEEGAAASTPTVPPPPRHHHRHHHHPQHQNRQQRRRYPEVCSSSSSSAELPVNPDESVNLARRSGGFWDELFCVLIHKTAGESQFMLTWNNISASGEVNAGAPP